MDVQHAMELLSQCDLGALVVSAEGVIRAANARAEALFPGAETLVGQSLPTLAPPLWVESENPVYANIAFGEYLLRCPTPEVTGLPPHTRLVVFREAENDACHDMLISVLNQINESVVLCDGESRIYLLNDAAVKMDSIVTQDVVGEKVENVYQMLDGGELAIPQAIREKRPKLHHRQAYTTRYGKNVNVISSTFPIAQNGQILGGFNVMEDWRMIDNLHKQIIDLQEKLVDRPVGKQRSKSALTAKYTFDDIIYVSAAMSEVVARCKQVAKNDSSVMIYGETGTGKELFAQGIHNASARADGPFLAINCAAIPESLLEGLLFGTERGAYTGAERRPGLFEQANGGTLLLDEINSMDINLQSKLLRVLQDGIIRRVGGASEIQVDVRVLSNINLPPYQAIEENKLRRDLFYRLGVVNINIPPLRERREDIALLAKYFIMEYNRKLVKNVKNISKTTLERFSAYHWPGNVRELQHAIEHAMNILRDDVSTITPEDIPEHITPENPPALAELPQALTPEHSLHGTMQDLERRAICKTLRETGGNVSEAARTLNMSRQNLQYRIKRYRIDMPALLRGDDGD